MNVFSAKMSDFIAEETLNRVFPQEWRDATLWDLIVIMMSVQNNHDNVFAQLNTDLTQLKDLVMNLAQSVLSLQMKVQALERRTEHDWLE